MKENWEIKKLGEVVEQIRGVSYKPSDLNPILAEGYVPLLRANNIQKKLVFDNLQFVSIKKVSAKQYIKKGDILVCTSSGSRHLVGKAAQASEDYEMTFGAFCKIIRPKNVNNRLIGHFFNSNKYRETISSLSRGANINNIKTEDIDNLEIPIPPLPIQEAIVKELDVLHRLKELQEQQLSEYDNLAQSTFYSMFGDPIDNEKGWEVKKLGEVCIINPPKAEIKDMDRETEVSFVPMANVSESGELELLENRKIKDVWNGFTYFADKDVLFAKITPCMENGKRTIAKQLKNGIGFGSTEFHVLRPKDKVISDYIFQILSLSDFRVIAEKKMTGSAGQKRVPKTFLEQFEVSVPPLSLQTDFAKRIEKIEAQKELVKQGIAETQLLIDYTMDKYFG